jgi:hypothetical protein
MIVQLIIAVNLLVSALSIVYLGIIGGIFLFLHLADTAFIAISMSMYLIHIVLIHIVSGTVLLFPVPVKEYFGKKTERSR